MTTIFAIFIILHGLVHFWYAILSLQLIPFRSEMGYTGQSWLWTKRIGDRATRIVAAIFYSVAALGFIAAGLGLLTSQTWFRPMMLSAAVTSLLAIGLFWDGSKSKLVEKGLLGFLISALVFIKLLVG